MDLTNNLPHPGHALRSPMRCDVRPAMALRIAVWLGVHRRGRAALWRAMQAAHDVWRVRKAMMKLNHTIARAFVRAVG
jgi:plasmid maintenance system antidote protein VapI